MRSPAAFAVLALVANVIAGPVRMVDDVDADLVKRDAQPPPPASAAPTTLSTTSASSASASAATTSQVSAWERALSHTPWRHRKGKKNKHSRPQKKKSSTKSSTKHTTKKPAKKTSTKPHKPVKTTHAAAPTASTYQEAVIYHHNYHRANHSAQPLTWSPKMASFAKGIAESCDYAHNVQYGGGGYGQNIAAGAPLQDISGVITDQFYNNEVKYYKGMYGTNNPDMSNFESWGHFSQVVWKDTREVGCYTIDCSGRKGGLKGITGQYSNIAPLFTVCNYSPPGMPDILHR